MAIQHKIHNIDVNNHEANTYIETCYTDNLSYVEGNPYSQWCTPLRGEYAHFPDLARVSGHK